MIKCVIECVIKCASKLGAAIRAKNMPEHVTKPRICKKLLVNVRGHNDTGLGVLRAWSAESFSRQDHTLVRVGFCQQDIQL